MTETKPSPEPETSFPVVGIAASAGGLDAESELLRALPLDTAMAFVLVQHLDPTHASALAEILSRATKLPVNQVEDEMPVEPNHVYVIPPGKNMVIERGKLQLSPRTEGRGQHRPADLFFRSLAVEQKHQAIGVVLSGTASDGTLGLVEIKGEGGITFAQDETAQQDSMPQSAIAAGVVDFVLPPHEIAEEIARIARHPYLRPGPDESVEPRQPNLSRIIELLRNAHEVDFTNYKRSTLFRRITRRMVLHKMEKLADYERFLEKNTAELDALFQDVLISVTSFFRNAEAFDALKTKVFPRLVESRQRNDPIRVWVQGCSTGEEAYSIAISFAEFADSIGRAVPVQIFATDLNGVGIEKARAGFYAKSILEDVSPERLRRFFTEEDGSFRICKAIRDSCVFARHNVLTAPPFSRMDFISCRNLMIYLEPVLQQRLVPTLHYALKPHGFLWLGNSETIGSYRNLFDLEDAKNKIYGKKAGSAHVHHPIPFEYGLPKPQTGQRPALREMPSSASDAQREADRLVLARYAPVGVLIDSNLDIIQFRGETGHYLKPAPGRASLNLLKMLREGLLVGVRGAINKAKKEGNAVRLEGLKVKSNGGYRTVNVEVMPVLGDRTRDGCTLVLFDEIEEGGRLRATTVETELPVPLEDKDDESTRLNQELSATREYLQSVIEQQEAANEELQSANEEVQSSNEELQSINEELETSKEEIQSANEELATVNDEMQTRNAELTQSNNDLNNLLSSVQMPILMLGSDLRLRRFTPMAEKVFNLIATDVGRPISDLKLNISLPELESLLVQVIETVAPVERDVEDRQGRWHLLRIRPYKTAENKIEGAVLMLVDVDSLKRAEKTVRESEARFRMLADSAPVLIWMNNLEGRVYFNRAYLDFVGAEIGELRGRGYIQFVHPLDRDNYLAAYRAAFDARAPFEGQFRLRHFRGEYRWMKSAGMPRFTEGGQFLGYVGATYDVHDLKEAQERLLQADRNKNHFLAMLAHELRNPLAPMGHVAELLKTRTSQKETAENCEILERQVDKMTRMIDDLLDVARITEGKIRLQFETLDLASALRNARRDLQEFCDSRRVVVSVVEPSEPVFLRGDPVRLEQIFYNLLSNACKFTPPDGKVVVTTEVDRAELECRVHVRDRGIGIAPELLPQVFDLFMQGDHSLQREQGGLGIGLTLVRRLVELHDGSIEAHSQGPGQGSEFVVRLPILVSSATKSTRATPLPARTSGGSHRILVVDDNVDSAQTLGALLRRWGHEVRVEHDGRAVNDAAKEFRPDVLILDIGLPGLDGYEVARQIRRQPRYRKATLIALSGYASDDDVRQAMAAGFDRHFSKPTDAEALREALAQVRPVRPARKARVK